MTNMQYFFIYICIKLEQASVKTENSWVEWFWPNLSRIPAWLHEWWHYNFREYFSKVTLIACLICYWRIQMCTCEKKTLEIIVPDRLRIKLSWTVEAVERYNLFWLQAFSYKVCFVIYVVTVYLETCDVYLVTVELDSVVISVSAGYSCTHLKSFSLNIPSKWLSGNIFETQHFLR